MEETDKDPLKKEIYDTLHRWYINSFYFLISIGLDIMNSGVDNMVCFTHQKCNLIDAIYEILKGKDVIVLMPTGGIVLVNTQ